MISDSQLPISDSISDSPGSISDSISDSVPLDAHTAFPVRLTENRKYFRFYFRFSASYFRFYFRFSGFYFRFSKTPS